MAKQAASPVSTGPGGERFEARVGAFYLLAMLLDSEPRGLPGAHIERIRFQGASDGSPLDDVIVHALRADGQRAVLEIQAKRRITFSPGDGQFRDVVEQISEVLKAGQLDNPEQHRVGVATAQTSRQIDGPYQEVLLWARASGSADLFFRKLGRPGTSNENMRSFVETLRSHLAEFGARCDDQEVWVVLRALQILVFDFSAESGQSDSLARDRCAQALEVDERAKAGALWSTLADIAQELATATGDIDLVTLRARLANEFGFRLAGQRHTRAARAAVGDASTSALHDIKNWVGNATLSRRVRLDAVNAAIDSAGYVEILGDAGVGKSGVLRTLAEQTALTSSVVVLSPTRTTPRGWAAMRQTFGFDGTATEFLSEIAASGGATLFIDGLDFFAETERATVNDLVRAGAGIPGFKVVATARRSFGAEEPSWLDPDALESLGRATIAIDELSDAELSELRSAAPELVPLLANTHPAREVARNLFRLDRLVGQPSGEPVPRTEAEMAKLWWETGDGAGGDQARERTRIIRDLAGRTIAGQSGAFRTDTLTSGPLGQLVRSATLLDLGGEKMVFRHDVFRDWAVANLLREDGSKIDLLPLAELAPASLARGVELATRFAIEDATDDVAWNVLLDRLSQPDVNTSWRRMAVIALVRSEVSAEVLDRTEARLLENGGYLLRELIRTLMATEVAPASRLLTGVSGPLAEQLANLSVPSGPGWRRLVAWVFGRRDRLPANAIPEAVDLFTQYAAATWLFDPLAKDLVAQLHGWLTEIERGEARSPVDRTPLFGGGLDYDRKGSLHLDLRSAFAALSTLQPTLAEQYLRLLLDSQRRSHGSAEHVIKAPGRFAEAAPTALAELTAAVLINEEKPDRRGAGGYGRSEPFTFVDKQFLSPSPARGPFVELLLHSPQNGLPLIRQLVLHACNYGSKPSDGEPGYVTVEMESGPRRFPYPGTYFWSRDAQGHYSVTSALMALEAWGHHRIDAGEDVGAVVRDVLGEEMVPAAYLLITVDLVLSHWPASRSAGIPFAGSPELLAWDRTRSVHERMGLDFGFGETEPRGIADRKSLKDRHSRSCCLEQVLPLYAFGPPEEIQAIRVRLERAAERLGQYGPEAGFGDPEFMAFAALNRLDRANYPSRTVTDEDGNEQTYFVYEPPEAEARHLAPRQAEVATRTADANLRAEIASAMEDPARSSTDLASRSVTLAQALEASGEEQADFDQTILMAAALVMRDGDDNLRREHGPWAAEKFQAAASLKEDPMHRMRDGLRFNPAGLAALGMTAAIRHGGGLAEARMLLEVAARGDPAFAHGFGADLTALAAIDARLPRAVLRCAFVGAIRPRLHSYDPAEAENDETKRLECSAQQATAVEAEWQWLRGHGDEPSWPSFPEDEPRVRERRYIGDRPVEHEEPRVPPPFYADHQAAAVWLLKFLGGGYASPQWLRPIADGYRDWTSQLNGAGRDRDDELSDTPNEWNRAYFRVVARCLPGLIEAEIDKLCVDPVVILPDNAFLGVMSDLILPLDDLYFDAKGLGEMDAVRVRTKLAERMQQTSNWESYVQRPGYGSEIHLDLALANLFFCGTGFRQPPSCYVTSLGMPRMPPFIPLLTDVAGRGPSLVMAMMVNSIVAVSPGYPFLAFGVASIAACMKRFPDDARLWIDYGIGKRFCAWINQLVQARGRSALDDEGVRSNVEGIVSSLIRLGLAEATALEGALQREA